MSYILYVHENKREIYPLLGSTLKTSNVLFVRGRERSLELLLNREKRTQVKTFKRPYQKAGKLCNTSLEELSRITSQTDVLICDPGYKLDGNLPTLIIFNGGTNEKELLIKKLQDYEHLKNLRVLPPRIPKAKYKL